MHWQGVEGNQFWTGELKEMAGASSILDAIRSRQNISKARILYPSYNSTTNMKQILSARAAYLEYLKQKVKDMNAQNTVIISILGESPYAEYMGDIGVEYCINTTSATEGCLYNLHLNPYLPPTQKTHLGLQLDEFSRMVIKAVKAKDSQIPIVSVLFAGRPMLIEETLNTSSAFIAAYLPGTSGGEAVISAITGEYLFREGNEHLRKNTLPAPWIRSMEQINHFPVYTADEKIPVIENPLFPADYGLVTMAKRTQTTE